MDANDIKNWIGKILCWFGRHKWDCHYIFDKNDPLAKYGRFHVIGGSRKCQRTDCKARQIMRREIPGENKIRWEKSWVMIPKKEKL